ncbi:alpha/beta hydrolase [Agreia sp. VKM Ac-1783]|uniref:alpha/beta hydrolase n=1 Tax=Agreia sp. VKM Ac-1783 TaxID=1938889 RepID=UPI000A2AE87C|nr:alpha/beta hydrolase [Agreia sp. VKM Ac-1783]SMQ71602.1 acetyl esterase [Agreia sp. VKM Ac-1783]
MTPTPIPARVRAWGWFMDRFRSMHIATMSPTDIEHNQTMRAIPAPVRRVVFGARDSRVEVRDLSIATSHGPLALRVYRPRDARTGASDLPIAVYFHGGGWTLFGGLDVCDWLPSRVAAELGAVVVAVDYRLAPQHPYPAAVDDCIAAVSWASEHAEEFGASPARLAVFGDSAGGNLSAVMALRARDSGGPPIRAQGLIYPVTDTTLDDESMHENARKPVLHRADMDAFFRYYLGASREHGADDDPSVSPVRASSLADLPPALVQVSAHDVLRDQALAYAARLSTEGTPVEVKTYAEAPHGWVTYPGIMRVSRRASADLVDFLRRALAVD